ncbi:MAG: response regulator transcription factor [Actinobacteria bacterium]|nr:response regulator transcription factor [Actinomycetota bacterium]
MAQILVIEDDPVINKTLEYNLKRAGFSVLTAGDGLVGLNLMQEEKPDLVLLDLMLPQIDGFQLCKEIRSNDPMVPVLMVTALEDESDMIRGLNLGADDYITKPFSMAELIARIKANLRRVHAAGVKKSRETIKIGDLTIEPDNYLVKVGDIEIRLRPKEFELLRLLASHPGTLFNRKELAERVWGYGFSASRTIDVHIKRIRDRIESVSNYNYIKTVHGVGYRFLVEEKNGEAGN